MDYYQIIQFYSSKITFKSQSMREIKPFRKFQPEVYTIQRKNSPLRLISTKRIYQLNMSKMLIRLSGNPDPEKNRLNECEMIIIQSKSPNKHEQDSNQNSLAYSQRKNALRLDLQLRRTQSKEIKEDLGNLEQFSLEIGQATAQLPSSVKTNNQRVLRNVSRSQQESNMVRSSKANYKIREPKMNNTAKKINFPFEPIKKAVSSIKPKTLTEIKNEKKIKYLPKKLPLLVRIPQELKNIKSESYIVIEHPSNTVIVSYHSTMSLQIASLTKIMTFYITLKIASENSINITTQKFQVQDHIMQITGTSAQLIGGQIFTIEQLLYGLMLPSGNDAAVCLAQWGGRFYTTEEDQNTRMKMFIMEMNRTARKLDLVNTRFGNPHGLPHFQSKSNAIEVAKLSSLCMNCEVFRKIVKAKKYKCLIENPAMKTHRDVEWENTNKLLRRQGFSGLKTGITVTAGPCLATAYKFRDKTYITVILRATKISRRFKQTRRLLFWSLNKLFGQSLTETENKDLTSLRKNKSYLDSDYSQDQQQFKYDVLGKAEFKKRCNILSYEM